MSCSHCKKQGATKTCALCLQDLYCNAECAAAHHECKAELVGNNMTTKEKKTLNLILKDFPFELRGLYHVDARRVETVIIQRLRELKHETHPEIKNVYRTHLKQLLNAFADIDLKRVFIPVVLTLDMELVDDVITRDNYTELQDQLFAKLFKKPERAEMLAHLLIISKVPWDAERLGKLLSKLIRKSYKVRENPELEHIKAQVRQYQRLEPLKKKGQAEVIHTSREDEEEEEEELLQAPRKKGGFESFTPAIPAPHTCEICNALKTDEFFSLERLRDGFNRRNLYAQWVHKSFFLGNDSGVQVTHVDRYIFDPKRDFMKHNGHWCLWVQPNNVWALKRGFFASALAKPELLEHIYIHPGTYMDTRDPEDLLGFAIPFCKIDHLFVPLLN
jgi:hypothetical protein